MTLLAAATNIFERTSLPDPASRFVVGAMVGRTAKRLQSQDHVAAASFAAAMADYPIAMHTELANRQHYELPPDFFGMMLGPRRKYSCCYYETPDTLLETAEEAALQLTIEHAGLVNGQRILELGCGWGSLSLCMARQFPSSEIVAVSNSKPQRLYIEDRAAALGLFNLTIITADMNDFTPEGRFDRIVSVEMFEHMSNWRALLTRLRNGLTPEGRLFLHVFTHRTGSYRFDPEDKADWIAQHFFTSGIMPSHGLINQFPDLFQVEEEWLWSGSHYALTARDWLRRFDGNPGKAATLLKQVYGQEWPLWRRRWRLFLLATEGLFGYQNGDVWGVSHYRLAPS